MPIYHLQGGCGTATELDGKPIVEFHNLTFNLSSGETAKIINMTCSGAYNGIFDGYIWLNYTRLPIPPSAINNSYFESEVASVDIP